MQLLEDVGRLAIDLVQYMVKKSLLVPSEEQFKRLECSLRRALCWCGFLAFSLILLLTGLGLIIWGIYALLAPAVGPGPSALIVGVVVCLLAAVLSMVCKSSAR